MPHETSPPQRVTVLGSTGSIGTNTLDVMARHPERFQVFALTGATQMDLMLRQCAQFKPRFVVMAHPPAAQALQERLHAEGLLTQVLTGAHALDEVSAHPDVDVVMAAIVGAAGLSPCLAAARAGKRLLLANKEALVVGGEVFLDAVKQGGRRCCLLTASTRQFFSHCLKMPAPGTRVLKNHSHGVWRSVSNPCLEHPQRGHARASVRPSQLGDGSKNFSRFGHHDEQSAGSD